MLEGILLNNSANHFCVENPVQGICIFVFNFFTLTFLDYLRQGKYANKHRLALFRSKLALKHSGNYFIYGKLDYAVVKEEHFDSHSRKHS